MQKKDRFRSTSFLTFIIAAYSMEIYLGGTVKLSEDEGMKKIAPFCHKKAWQEEANSINQRFSLKFIFCCL